MSLKVCLSGYRIRLLILIFSLSVSCCTENVTETSFHWLMHMFDPYNFGNFSETTMNEICRKDVNEYVDALRRDELWAVQMSDANGRYSSQFFFGNDYWLGSKTLCTEISKSKLAPYQLKFHVAQLLIKLSTNLTPRDRLVLMGTCLPASCRSDDIKAILSYHLNVSQVTEKAHMTVARVRPVPGNYNILEDKKFLALGGSVLVIAFLMSLGTLLEFILNHKEKTRKKNRSNQIEGKNDENPSDIENNNEKKHSFEIKGKGNVYKVTEKENQENERKSGKIKKAQEKMDEKGEEKEMSANFTCQFLLSFSILSNASKILSCSNSQEDSLNSVHGLRFLSLAWVVLVHTYLQIFSIGGNKGLRAVTEKNFVYQIVGNATYSVDSFFIISGLLVSYLYFKNNAKKTPTDGFVRIINRFIMLVLYRFVRLTPVYIVVLGIVHLTMTFLKDISVFETPLVVELNCDTYWWRNILYVNNFFPRKEMCMLWSWYMATDTQFFVLSALLLLIAKRYFKVSIFFLFTLLLSSWSTTAYIAYTHQFRVKVEEPFALFDELYDKPWTRIGPYIVGICAGWLLSEKKCKISMPLPVAIMGWILSLGGLIGLIFCIGNGLGVVESSVYAALGHTAWGLSVAWIVVACRCGYGGWVNSLLSWPAFFPLSRLTYCAYLVHPVIMFLTNYVMDGPFHMHNGVVMIVFLGNLVSSYLFSFILSLAFEAPFVRLLKLILLPQKR